MKFLISEAVYDNKILSLHKTVRQEVVQVIVQHDV